MTNTAEAVFWQNAHDVLRRMRMRHLHPAHGAAVDIVRWCMVVRGRPTHHRERFLESESPALLAYLERLASNADAVGWRTLEQRVKLHAQILNETGMQPCESPRLAAIWHSLPTLAALGQKILDRVAENKELLKQLGLLTPDDVAGSGDDTGKAGKAGSVASARPGPPLLLLPRISVVPTRTEEKALDLEEPPSDEPETGDEPDPDGPDGTEGPKGPGGPK